MVDYFFSKKKKETKKIDYNSIIDDLMEKLAEKVARKINVRQSQSNEEEKVIKVPDKRDFREILEEEVEKFDSIEEVRYLGEYLVNYWKKIHLK